MFSFRLASQFLCVGNLREDLLVQLILHLAELLVLIHRGLLGAGGQSLVQNFLFFFLYNYFVGTGVVKS
jgi:hypothetical protein